ncbi:MAG: hypothetical protein WB992_22395 [Bryobacteraceae bacterium]
MAVRFQHLILNRDQPQFFGPARQTRAITDQVQLKAVVLWELSNSLGECREAIRLKSTVGIGEEQDRAIGILNATILGCSDSSMSLSYDCERVRPTPSTNGFRCFLQAPVINDDNFQRRAIRLVVQREQTVFQMFPIVVNGDDDAELRRL